jgi:FG-GAP-like repeat/ASPIC and UnbV
MLRRPGRHARNALSMVLALVGLASSARPAVSDDAGTREMAALLKERAAQVDPARLTFFVNDRRAAMAEAAFRQARSPKDRLDARVMYATELLSSGRIEDSIKVFEALEDDARTWDPGKWEQGATDILLQKAMAYLRMGEEQNCHQLNNRDSCLLPIRDQGVHQKRFGSTKAIEMLQAVLDRAPENLKARWLMNIAHMTLGDYPDGVPKAQVIPPSAFASDYPLPRFTNVAKEAGVDVYGLAGGAIMDDFDNDGRLDLMVSHAGLEDQMRLFWNRGDGTFEDRTEKAGLIGEVGGLNMIQADYDNDGFVDVLVLRGGWMGKDGRFPLSLLHNNGDGTFSDVTKAAGLLRFAPTQTAVWFDYDGDGWLDLFVGNESAPDDPYPCHLFHSNRDGTFTDVAHAAGVDVVQFVKGVTAGDYDNDGRPDLYLSVQLGENILFHNDGPQPGGNGWHFTNVAQRAGVTEPRNSFGTFFFDYDNDGRLDLFVAGYGGTRGLGGMAESVAADYLGLPTVGERGRLYHNRGDGTFEDVTKAAGLYKVVPTMGHNFGDIDNDGWLDIYLGTGNPDFSSLIPNRMFRNDGGRRFQDVTIAGDFGNLQKGHAVAFGDYDNDGDQDVFEEMGGAYLADKAYSTLFQNPGNGNHWMSVELTGVRSNRRGIGARIEVTVETKHGPRSIFRTVGSGGSFGGNPLRQEIGLGDARRIVSVRVFWPVTGETQTIVGLKLDHRYAIREGDSEAQLLIRPSFALGGKR